MIITLPSGFVTIALPVAGSYDVVLPAVYDDSNDVMVAGSSDGVVMNKEHKKRISVSMIDESLYYCSVMSY